MLLFFKVIFLCCFSHWPVIINMTKIKLDPLEMHPLWFSVDHLNGKAVCGCWSFTQLTCQILSNWGSTWNIIAVFFLHCSMGRLFNTFDKSLYEMTTNVRYFYVDLRSNMFPSELCWVNHSLNVLFTS